MSGLYRCLLRPLLFSVHPETAHDIVLWAARGLALTPAFRIAKTLAGQDDSRLAANCFGRTFANPIGLAAGFDKNCVVPELFAALGFGFVEVGTITGQLQSGNPKPRIFRLKADQALINRMGFPSQGVTEVLPNLKAAQLLRSQIVLGVNIGKSKLTPVEDAAIEYQQIFTKLSSLGDYFVLNVSSPNTPELRKLQEKARLTELLRLVMEANKTSVPVLVKVAPDLTVAELDQVIGCALDCKLSGIIAVNTTFSRAGLFAKIDQAGGLSGRPLKDKGLDFVRHIYKSTAGALPVIGCGGIFSSQDVLDYFRAGASLVQIYTGLIYEGPFLVRTIKRELIQFLDREKLKSLQQLRET